MSGQKAASDDQPVQQDTNSNASFQFPSIGATPTEATDNSSSTHDSRAGVSLGSEVYGMKSWNTYRQNTGGTDAANAIVGELQLFDPASDNPEANLAAQGNNPAQRTEAPQPTAEGSPEGRKTGDTERSEGAQGTVEPETAERTGDPEKPITTEKPGDSDQPAETSPGTDQPTGQQCDSEVECIRQTLLENGIDPDRNTTPMAVFEPEPPIEEAQPQAQDHIAQVGCTISDPELGLSRNAPLEYIRDQAQLPTDLTRYQGENGVQDFVADSTVAMLDHVNNVLQQRFLSPGSNLRVMNMSFGTAPADVAENMLAAIQQNPEESADLVRRLLGEERGNQLLEELRNNPDKPPEGADTTPPPALNTPGQCRDVRQPGPQPPDRPEPTELERELYQRLLDTVSPVMQNDPRIREALDRYRETTRQVAENGGIIVISAANNGDLAQRYNATMPPGSEYNLLAQSDHVISVGGSDNNGTPGDYSDDTVWGPSSRGTGQHNPTILAPSSQLPSRQSEEGVLDGTSFGAPLVTGTIGLMLEQNPSLTFQQVRELLQNNAIRLPNVPAEHQGGGILRPADAIIAARNLRR